MIEAGQLKGSILSKEDADPERRRLALIQVERIFRMSKITQIEKALAQLRFDYPDLLPVKRGRFL